MSNTGNAGPLNYTAKLDISQAQKNAEKLKKTFADLAASTLAANKLSDSQKSSIDSITDAVNANANAKKKLVSADNSAGKSLTDYQKRLLEFKKLLIDAQAASEDLRRKNLELDAAYKQGRITAQELSAAERQAKKDRQALAEATKAARQAQVAASGSYDEANARLKELGRSIKAAEGGFNSTNPAIRAQIAEYNRLNQSLKDFDDQMGNHQRHVGDYKRALSGVGDDLKALALNYLSLSGALAAITYEIKLNAEISDSLSDVRRTAGLTADEVNNLAEALKLIDTRTSLKGLLEIATIGGQLGISKDQLAGFTKAVDELAVSLSGELQGGAEGIAKSLGVLDNVFGVTKSNAGDVEKSYNQIGSAILGLGQSGLATGDFLTDFGERVGGLAKQAKLSLPVILSYGAVLQENGVSAEVAGSSFKRLLSALTTNRTKFFAVAQLADANLTLKDFTNIINTDTKHALDLFFAGLEKGGTTTTAFNDILKSLKLTGPGVSQTVAALAANQQELNDHIQQSVTDFNDATFAADQFKIKNDNLAGSVAKLKNEFDNDLQGGSIGNFFKFIIDQARVTLKGLELLGTEVKNIFTNANGQGLAAKLFDNEDILSRKVAVTSNYKPSNLALQNFAKDNNPTGASNSVVSAVISDKPIKEIEGMVSQYKKATDQAYKALSAYKKGIKDGIIEDGGDISLDQAQKNYDKLKTVLGVVTSAYDQAKAKSKEAAKSQVQDAKEIADSELKTAEAIRARIKELQSDALANPANKTTDVKRIQALKETLKSVSGNPESESRIRDQYDVALKAQRDMQKGIDDLVKKGKDKQLSADDQEIEAVRKLYADKLAEAKTYNEKQAKLDAEARKKGQKAKGLRVDGSGLEFAGTRAEDAVRDKQATEKLKIELDKQKSLYDDYEAYRLKVGKENADKYYKDQIDTNLTYLQYLNSKKQALENGDPKAKGGSDVDKAKIQLQSKLLDEQMAAAVAANKKKDAEIFADSYRAAEEHYQKLLEIQSDYQKQVQALGDNATKEQIDNLTRQRDERIKSENDANFDIQTGWEHLFDNFDKMSREAILKKLKLEKALVIDAVNQNKKDPTKGIDANTGAEKIRQIDQAIESIDGNAGFARVAEKFKAWQDAMHNVDATSEEVKGAFRELLGSVSDVSGIITEDLDKIGTSLGDAGIGGEALQNTFSKVKGIVSGAGQFAKGYATGNPIDMIAGSVKFLSSAISLFNNKDAKLQKKIDGYKKELDSLGAAYKKLDRDVQNAAGNDIYVDQAAQIENLKQQQVKLIQIRDAESQKKKADQGKIDSYNQQIADIPNQIDDINKAISQNLIQGTFRQLSDSLADALTNAFQAGEDGIAAMDKSLDQFIANAIKNSLKLAFFDKDVKQFTDDLTDYAKAHDNSVVGFDFEAWRRVFGQDAENFDAGLKASQDFFKAANADDNSNSAKGKIEASITEDTATRLYGVEAGTQVGVLQVRDGVNQVRTGVLQISSDMKSLADNFAQSYQLAMDNFKISVQIEANTRRGADNTDGLIPALKEMIPTLKNIDNNTKGTSLRGAGLG